MSRRKTQQPSPHNPNDILYLNTDHLLAMLYQMKLAETMDGVRGVIAEVHNQLASGNGRMHASGHPDELTTIRRSYLLNELDQIHRTRTLERAHYYSGRLIKALTEEKTSKINDININRWKEYEHIHTDSLWVEDRRDSSGAHTAGYWGNFIPQIPRQMMLRYTKQGEWVLDTFAGSGTTLIEGQRLGRHTIGVELQPTVADQARGYISQEPNNYGVTCDLITGDSTTTDFEAVLQQHGQSSVQMVMMHPPYHDIIVFSEDERDLSNAPSLDAFLETIGQAVENVARVLDRRRYLILVIGDKYARGEWIPLGFQAMQEVTSRGFLLKSIVVKNFGRGKTTGKRYQEELWRYRALVGGFYVFKHEYIFVFQKKR